MAKNNNIAVPTTPTLKIRLKLNLIHVSNTEKIQKSSASSPTLKEKKKKRKHRSKLQRSQKNEIDNKSVVSPSPATKPNRLVYWTSERIESTKLILRTVIMAN